MIIRLSEELERFVQDAVRAGLYAGTDDVILDALTRLRQSIPTATSPATRKSKVTRQSMPKEEPVTPDELNRRLLASGLVIQLPDPAEYIDDAEDLPIEIQGEPLSETIIRERR
jgi:Arc/MetJ-type ribon-helix-helix transcriptional regulator